MDMDLPVLDGWEATRRLKADPATQSIPMIALTAHALQTDCDRAYQSGCDDFATKPIDFNSLLDKITRALEGGRRSPVRDGAASESGPQKSAIDIPPRSSTCLFGGGAS